MLWWLVAALMACGGSTHETPVDRAGAEAPLDASAAVSEPRVAQAPADVSASAAEGTPSQVPQPLIGALRTAPLERPGKVVWLCGEGERAGFSCRTAEGGAISLCVSEGAGDGSYVQLRAGMVQAPEVSVPASGERTAVLHSLSWGAETVREVVVAEAGGVATLRLRIAEDPRSGMMEPAEGALVWRDADGVRRWGCDLSTSWFEDSSVLDALPSGG